MTDLEKADTFITGICLRLEGLAKNRPYRFVKSPRDAAEAFKQLQASFEGYSEAEIAQAEKRLRVVFPLLFRTFLMRMGKRHGDLYVGSDFPTLDRLEEIRDHAQGLMLISNVSEPLPPSAIVFLLHQSYTFCYFLAEGGFDSPVWNYREGEARPEQRFASYGDLLLDEVGLMEEVNGK